jgi:hypothetical protein
MEATASSQRLDRAPRELDRSLPTEQLQQDEHPLMIRVLRTSRDAQEDEGRKRAKDRGVRFGRPAALNTAPTAGSSPTALPMAMRRLT